MNSILETKLANLPSDPGVYQFKNAKGRIIYVGKAKALKNRVRSYFQSNVPNLRTQIMVRQIADVELIITSNEIEALVLENNLIKELKPRYNVNLKDDKSFPFIKVTKEMFPRIYPTRTVRRDGSRYFGPYTDVKSMRASLRLINQIFKIRSCKLDITQEAIDAGKFKICLDYHIKKCDGPCEGLVSEEDYKTMVQQVIKMLSGRTDELIKEMKADMQTAAEQMEFEKAAEMRDRISQLESFSERQKIVTNDFGDRDVVAVAYEGKDATCSLFNVRSGKLVGKKQFRVSVHEGEELPTIYAAVLKQYYTDYIDIPGELVIETEPEDAEVILEWLAEKASHKVKLTVPQRGNLKQLVKLSKENATLQLKEIQLQKMKKEGDIPYTLAALKRDLRLPRPPRHIECFDISNLQSSDIVASMVMFGDAKPKKSNYRKYIINDTVRGPDDFASMNEVVYRRYKRIKEEDGKFPDLIMIDGGKGQLSAAVKALKKLEITDYQIIGLAKRLEEVFLPGESDPVIIPKTSSSLKLLQQVRDEAHRFAVTFHRQRRSRRTISTELTEIKGIGPKISEKLLKEIGSLKKIKEADEKQLAELVGDKKAALIKEHFQTTG